MSPVERDVVEVVAARDCGDYPDLRNWITCLCGRRYLVCCVCHRVLVGCGCARNVVQP
jgi:hypothetical protein